MIKIENVVLPSAKQWKVIIMGCRNPMNSWSRSDSDYCREYSGCEKTRECDTCPECYELGENDLSLMKKLANAGTDHRKFMRMITVYLDITGPLYWWKEFDTYKVGTVANSCSTMHKIHAKEFTLEDFSCEHLSDETVTVTWNDQNYLDSFTDCLYDVIGILNAARDKYLETKDKKYWWQMIQLLPSSYNQRRTVMLNYEVLANIYNGRRNHRLDEWHAFCDWIETLPYSELITGENTNEKHD